jgi:hypothetical protein
MGGRGAAFTMHCQENGEGRSDTFSFQLLAGGRLLKCALSLTRQAVHSARSPSSRWLVAGYLNAHYH